MQAIRSVQIVEYVEECADKRYEIMPLLCVNNTVGLVIVLIVH